jgi:polysaccharide pyruvyl transferase WcaK-like protein
VTIALFLGHATSNLGDVALNTGAEQLIERAGSRLDTVLMAPTGKLRYRAARRSFTTGPAVVRLHRDALSDGALLEYTAHPERFFRHYGLEGVETVVIHSGEHLYAPKSLGDLHRLALWRLLPAIAGKATGRRVIVLPSTLGPFENRRLAHLYRSSIDIVDAIAARDAVSPAYLDRSVPVLLDPAFFVRPAHPATPDVPALAVSMRLEDVGLRVGATRSARRLDAAADSGFAQSRSYQLLRDLLLESLDVFPAADIRLLVQALSDEALADSVLESIPIDDRRGRVEIVRAHLGEVDDFVDLLAGHRVMVSSRFHACVLSMACGVPAVGITLSSHGHKIRGLFEQLGVSEFHIDATTADVGSARAALARAADTAAFDAVWPRLEALRDETAQWLASSLSAPVRDTRDQAAPLLKALAAATRRVAGAARVRGPA